jgi:hypothetical protein
MKVPFLVGWVASFCCPPSNYSNDQYFIQVGTWGYDAGKELLAHIHNTVERKVLKTQEVLYVRKGSIWADNQGLRMELK